MSRKIHIGAAQLGPIARNETRPQVVARLIALMREAKAGKEEGCDLLGQSCNIAPTGEMVAMCSTVEDELVTAVCELDRCRELKDNVFNFGLHREPETYRLIVETKGTVEPA